MSNKPFLTDGELKMTIKALHYYRTSVPEVTPQDEEDLIYALQVFEKIWKKGWSQ